MTRQKLKNPSKKATLDYTIFWEQYAKAIRKRNKKRKPGMPKLEFCLPGIRGHEATMLVPDGECYPCDVCPHGVPNHACKFVSGCAAVAYHGLLLIQKFNAVGAAQALNQFTNPKEINND